MAVHMLHASAHVVYATLSMGVDEAISLGGDWPPVNDGICPTLQPVLIPTLSCFVFLSERRSVICLK